MIRACECPSRDDRAPAVCWQRRRRFLGCPSGGRASIMTPDATSRNSLGAHPRREAARKERREVPWACRPASVVRHDFVGDERARAGQENATTTSSGRPGKAFPPRGSDSAGVRRSEPGGVMRGFLPPEMSVPMSRLGRRSVPFAGHVVVAVGSRCYDRAFLRQTPQIAGVVVLAQELAPLSWKSTVGRVGFRWLGGRGIHL